MGTLEHADGIGTQWTPSIGGDVCAAQLHDGTQNPQELLHEYRWRLRDYYGESGYSAWNSEKAYATIVRWSLRAVSAPLLFGIEKELESYVQTAWPSDGSPLAALPASFAHNAPAMRARIQNGQHVSYTGRQWAFLEAASYMAYQAGIRYLWQVESKPQDRSYQLLQLFRKIDTESAAVYPFPRHFHMRTGARERLLDNVITSTRTVLQTLEIAHRHGVAERTAQLGWLATTSLQFFERYFGTAALHDTHAPCPFTSPPRISETGVIWRTPPLTNGPWPSRRFCPENVPLWDGLSYVTAAEIRLRSVMPLARQTLLQATLE